MLLNYYSTLLLSGRLIRVLILSQVVLNLMGNAFKFTTRGALKVSLKYTNQGALLAVSDTGCGIPQSELSRIFDRFHTVGRAQEGTGIGLALVAEIVRLHGGTVDVRGFDLHRSVVTSTLVGGE